MKVYIALVIFSIFTLVPSTTAKCTLPPEYIKTLYARQGGTRANVYLEKNSNIIYRTEKKSTDDVEAWPTDEEMIISLKGSCYKIVSQDTKQENSVKDLTVLFYNSTKNCYFCFKFFHRSPNVMEFRNSMCVGDQDICARTTGTTLITGFAHSDTYTPYNCKNLFEGVFEFTYELKDAYGECSNRRNLIEACQATGSSLRDNTIFKKVRGWCPGQVGSGAQAVKSGTTEEKWKCYGVWTDKNGNIKAAIQLDSVDTKFRYRCMLSTVNQQATNNYRKWGMTTSADCSKLVNDYGNAEYRLKLRPSLNFKTHLPFLKPACNLPKTFVGHWFFPGDYNTEVTINSTHMIYKRMKNQYEYENVYYSCRQTQDNRFLMATVAAGRCEMDFICFFFQPRHHNVIRFRTTRPFRYYPDKDSNDYMVQVFRQACHWHSFTLNNRQWVYQYFILNPPVPTNCPIQGRFKFVQTGDLSERYKTKIPGGVTLRPRIQVLCDNKHNESDLAICTSNLKAMKLDVSRCMVVDHTGRPTSEYDIQDNTLTCVGYWMEDARSYLITYDPDDAVSQNFRCWVYKRIAFHTYLMSRSSGGHCGSQQTAETNSSDDGVSLHLELHTNEREFDGCPMQFNDGRDPFGITSQLNVYSAGCRLIDSPFLLLSGFLLITFLLRL